MKIYDLMGIIFIGLLIAVLALIVARVIAVGAQ